MAEKSSPVVHGVRGSSSVQESSRGRRRDKVKAVCPVDILIKDFDITIGDGSDPSKAIFSTLIDYEPVFIKHNSLSGVTTTCEEITQEYDLEQLQHQEGTTHHGRSVDFITRLPPTLLRKVLCRLDPETLAEASLVCNDWYCRLNEFATKWSHVELSDNDDYVNATYENLVSVSPYIQSLSVQFLNTDEPIDALIQSLARLNFGNLKSLDLGCMVTRSEFVFNLLDKVKDTLSHLSLMCVAHDGLSLAGILSTCINLTHLRHCTPVLNGADLDSFSGVPGIYTLKSVQLMSNSISFDTLAPMLQHTPQIQSLVLCECKPDVIDALNQYAGSHLEYLHINPDLEHRFPPWVDVEYTPRADGLNMVIANKMESRSLEKLATMLVERAQSSLQHLHISTTACSDGYVPWVNNCARFDALRTLSWNGIMSSSSSSSSSLGPTVAAVIRQSPNLGEVTFENCKVVDAEMLAAVSDLKKLQKLAIVPADTVDQEHLARFLLTHSALMHTSPLEEFKLTCQSSSALVPDTLEALSKVITLRRIGLAIQGSSTDLKHFVSVEDMDRFIACLSSSRSHNSSSTPGLQSVTLTALDAVTDSGLRKLGEIDGLIEVTLTDLACITNQGVHHLVDACPSLQSVLIERCPMVSHDTLANIEKKLMQRATKIA